MVDPNGTLIFPDEYGFMQRHALACDYSAGGVFGISITVFQAVQQAICTVDSPQNARLLEAAQRLLLGVDFCSLQYEALRSCVVSGLTARLWMYLMFPEVPQLPDEQAAKWSQFFQIPNCTIYNFTKTTPPTTDSKCRLRICVVLDESGSITAPNFAIARSGLLAFVQNPALDDDTLISLVKFSTSTTLVFNWLSPAKAAAIIPSVPYNGGWTNTALGMQLGRSLFPKPNDDELFIMVVMTDGQCTSPANLKVETDNFPKFITPIRHRDRGVR